LRNNALDAKNFSIKAPLRHSNATNLALPLAVQSKNDKTFFFASYEGLRQNLHQTSAAFVPDAASRASAVPSVQPLLNLWLTAPAGRSGLNGIAEVFSNRCKPFAKISAPSVSDHNFSGNRLARRNLYSR